MAGAQEAGAPLVVKNCGSAACGSGAASACVLELSAEARRERSGRCRASNIFAYRGTRTLAQVKRRWGQRIASRGERNVANFMFRYLWRRN